jgi:hypothetical protein
MMITLIIVQIQRLNKSFEVNSMRVLGVDDGRGIREHL